MHVRLASLLCVSALACRPKQEDFADDFSASLCSWADECIYDVDDDLVQECEDTLLGPLQEAATHADCEYDAANADECLNHLEDGCGAQVTRIVLSCSSVYTGDGCPADIQTLLGRVGF